MSNSAFRTSSTNQITNQPPADSLVILRSTSDSETTTVNLYGIVNGAKATGLLTFTGNVIGSETCTIDGQVITFQTSGPYVLDNVIEIAVSISNFSAGTTMEEFINNKTPSIGGVVFHNRTFDSPISAESTELGAYTAVTADDYGDAANLIDTTESFPNGSWANATLTGGDDDLPETPTVEGVFISGDVEIPSVDPFASIHQGLATTTPSGNITALSTGTAAEGDISALANPSDGAILTIGLAGNTQAYRFKNTTAAAYDVNIGASATDTMLSLKRALNADGTPGVDYHAGTLINPQLSGTVATVVITVTDRLACKRQLAWTFTEAATDFALRIPRGGEDGTLIFSLSPTVEIAADNLTFSTEDHSTDTLPALRIAESVTVAVGGDIAAYRIYNELAIKVVFQTSTDQINWLDTAEGELTLGADTTTFANFTLPTEFLRFKVTENLSVVDGALDARVIY